LRWTYRDAASNLAPRGDDFAAATQRAETLFRGPAAFPIPTATQRRTPPVEIYLPIADIPVNLFLLFFMGIAVGFISGMFGIGGGFLMTPLLIFIGISPAVAVASVASHISASSFSGVIAYWRRSAIDLALALMLLCGGIIGTMAGVWLFSFLRTIGQLDITIGLSYVTLLSIVGGMMIAESMRAIMRARQGKPAELRRPGSHTWIHGLPFKIRFKQSKIYVSAIPVCVIGFVIGFIGAVMGICRSRSGSNNRKSTSPPFRCASSALSSASSAR
jgi:uncharacterized membrane protein YfcA